MRATGIDLVAHTVETSHQQCREAEVRIRRRVRAAELDPLRLRARRVDGNSNGGRAVALRVDEIDWRLETRHQTAIRVHRRRGQREQGWTVAQKTADVVLRELAETGITVRIEHQVRAV